MPLPQIITNLDPVTFALLQAHDAAFHRWQQCIGPEEKRWREGRFTTNALYDQLSILDDYYAAYQQNGYSFNIHKFRLWRKIVNNRIAKMEIEYESNRWVTRGRDNGYVYADVCGALQNTLQGLLYRTVTKENCQDY